MRSVATGTNGVTETREVATSPISAAGNKRAPADADEIISGTNDGFVTFTRRSKKCAKQKLNGELAVQTTTGGGGGS